MKKEEFYPITGNPEAGDYLDYYNWLMEQKSKEEKPEAGDLPE